MRPTVEPVAIVATALLTCVLLALLPSEMSPDGWYALLGGDVIIHHGLPSHDALTVWGAGRRWVDQQWLAQLGYYGLYELGGLRVALIVNAAVVAGAYVAAVTLARRRGGSRPAVAVVAAVAAVSIGVASSALRPQTLALPLFVTLSWLLIQDARSPSRRVFWCIPLLALWANVHGSVTLGALLVVVRVVVSAWSRRRLALERAAFAALAVGAQFASPYARHLGWYYRTILFNREFAKFLPDWMPTALSLRTVAFYALALATVFALARAPGLLTAFERVALLLLLLLGIDASRGVTWFSLFAVIVVPTVVAEAVPLRSPIVPHRLVDAAVAASGVASVVAVVLAAIQPSSWYSRDYPPEGARAAAAAAGASGTVFANAAYADWLLFREPSLRGRVAYDARFELLPRGRLAQAAAVSIGRSDASRILRRFDVVVLRPVETELRDQLERTGVWRAVSSSSRVVVLRRAG
jgi:hypothetical protein